MSPYYVPEYVESTALQNTTMEGFVVVAGERLATEAFHYEVAPEVAPENAQPLALLTVEALPIDRMGPPNLEGLSLWPGSQVLGSYLLSKEGRALVKDKDVVELGCGVGLLGPVLLLAGARSVILTDFNPHSLMLAKQNMERNQSAVADALSRSGEKMGSFSVQHLDWCEWGSEGNTLDGTFDVALASDVVYKPEIRQGLETVLLALTDRNPSCTVMLVAPFRHSRSDAIGAQRDWLGGLSWSNPDPQTEKDSSEEQKRSGTGSRSPRRIDDSKLGPFKVEALTECGPWDCCDVDGYTGMESWQHLRVCKLSPLYGCDPQPHLFRLYRQGACIVPAKN